MGSADELAGKAFHVSVHDVAPPWEREIGAVFAALRPLLGTTMSAAVVPCWGGVALRAGELAEVTDSAEEILLHGWHHHRTHGRGAVSVLTGGADEFSGLTRSAAIERLRRGLAVLGEAVDARIEGFLPPAYQCGRVDAAVLDEVGLRYRVGWGSATAVAGGSVRLATTIWDVSPVAGLSRCAATVGRVARWRRQAVPTIAVHPADVRRGLLPDIVAEVTALSATGRRPVLVRDLLGVSAR